MKHSLRKLGATLRVIVKDIKMLLYEWWKSE